MASVARVLWGLSHRVADDAQGDVGRVALASQHAGQPTGLDIGVKSGHGAQLLGDQLAGTLFLADGIDPIETALAIEESYSRLWAELTLTEEGHMCPRCGTYQSY